MGARYAVTAAENAVTASYTTAGNVVGGTGVRVRLYDFIVGQGATPADTAVYWALQRSTTAGTLTSVTPAPLDSADPAAEATAGENATIEPTYTAATEIVEMPLNQRATYRWVAAPGGEVIVPATASNGLGFRVKGASYTGTAEVAFHFEE